MLPSPDSSNTRARANRLRGAYGAVKIHQAIHVIPGDQVTLQRLERPDIHQQAVGIVAQHQQDPLEVVPPHLDARHLRVTQQIVEAVRIHLTRNDRLSVIRRRAAQQLHDPRRQRRIHRPEHTIDLGRFVQNHPRGVVLVIKAEHPLHRMTERRMTDIMKQRRADDGRALQLVGHLQRVAHPARNVADPHRVRETRMFRSVVHEAGQTELPNVTQSLHLCGVHQRAYQAADRAGILPRDDVVHGVAKCLG